MREAEQAKRRRLRALKRIGVGAILVLLLPIACWLWLCTPPGGDHTPIPVTIPAGTSLHGVGDVLARNHIVRNGLVFALYARLHGAGRELRSGRHQLSGDMTFDQILEALRRADTLPAGVAVTLPEGFTLAQVAARLQNKGIVEADAFLAAARGDNPEVNAGIDFALPSGTLEGYLYPDTYRFKPHTSAAEAAHTMLVNFGDRFARPYRSEAAGCGRSLHDLVTLASLIEREAKAPQDRPRIAGVIANRLQRKMRLEIDATVLYALGHHKQRVLYRDLDVKSPYNTYRHYGLPPGPIANPGLQSLLAALRPEHHAYLYYVARPDGTHLFSRTRAEHEAAKRQARRERKAQQNGSRNGREATQGG